MSRSMRKWASSLVLSALLLLCVVGAAVATGPTGPTGPKNRENQWEGGRAKYVFMFIGDGMGLQQISATDAV